MNKDLSHEPPDTPLPDAVAQGKETFLVVGAMAGGNASLSGANMQFFRGINVVSIAVSDLNIARHFYSQTLRLGTPIYPFGNRLQMCSPAPAQLDSTSL